jgi:uncharacterized membrane protein (UPF0127 family)
MTGSFDRMLGRTVWMSALPLLLTCAACCSCKADPPTKPAAPRSVDVRIVPAGGDAVTVKAELAITEEERRRGLMYRERLEDGEGMLFIFQEDAEHPFWMKNTKIPLDMLFLDSGRRVVGILRNTIPMKEKSLSVGLPSRYVLEVPAGFCDRHGIHREDRVEFEL